MNSVNGDVESLADGHSGRVSFLDSLKFGRTETLLSPGNSSTSPSDVEEFNPFRQLNTFSGVFAPVALSMFSAILFLRIGYVVGNCGLYLTILELVLAYIILFSTVLSVCAIATNGPIEGGGAYYMISRALGPEFGGSVGTLFFIANVFSSALYITGCVEGILSNFGPSGAIISALPSGYWWTILYGSSLNFVNVIICLVGAALFAKTSVFIFVIVMISASSVIVSFIFRHNLVIPIPHDNHDINQTMVESLHFTGISWETLKNNLMSNYSTDYSTDQMTSFSGVFGVLFSGVTGIMAGANISGELKDPGESIPKGTIRAAFFTFFTYLTLFVLSAASCPRELLQNNFIYMQPVDYVPCLVAVGIFAATFSASLSNLIGASRILEALSRDKLFGPLLNPVLKYTVPGNPFFAVVVTWFVVQCILFINKLNLIAQITSGFFLITYFAINLACMALTLTSAPNFRPSFKYFTWKTAAIGITGSLVMMFVINAIYAAVTVFLLFALFGLLHVISPPLRWGSITQALIFHQVRKYLLILDSRKEHVKYWRPHVLLMASNPRSCIPLIQFANDMKKSGLFLIGHIKIGNIEEFAVDPILDEFPKWLQLLDMLHVKAFLELTMAKTVSEGFHHLVRITGLGAMKPNTVMFGFYDDEPQIDFFEKNPNYACVRDSDINETDFLMLRNHDERNLDRAEYVQLIRDSMNKFMKNVCIARYFNQFNRDEIALSKNKVIDIWPINFYIQSEGISDQSWKFMVQLACILQMVPRWKNTKLRLLATDQLPNIENVQQIWAKKLKQLRIDCEIEMAYWPQENSSDVDIYKADADQIYDHFNRANEFLKFYSTNSTLLFMYLPPPPLNKAMNEDYLEHLKLLTEGLPPTILAHGITDVTSDSN